MRIGTALLLVAALLAGCAAEAPTPPSVPLDEREESQPAPLVAERPTHAVGRAWTYEGDEQYNEDAAFTVVVARADRDGYLFAGAAEDDVVYAALWGSPWIGERDLDGDPEGVNHLDFPIEDGKSWALNERMTVTARARDVRTPMGTERGFVIEGTSERSRVSYDYSPSLGAITRYEGGPLEGDPWDVVRLTGVAENSEWVWYERGELVVVANPHEPQAFELDEGFDAVLASAGGSGGGRALVVPPGGAQPWSVEFGDDEDWRHATFDAVAGQWSAEVLGEPYVEDAPELPADAPIGWAYMHLAPVRWLRGP